MWHALISSNASYCPFLSLRVQQFDQVTSEKAALEDDKQQLFDLADAQAREHDVAMNRQLQRQREEAAAVSECP